MNYSTNSANNPVTLSDLAANVEEWETKLAPATYLKRWIAPGLDLPIYRSIAERMEHDTLDTFHCAFVNADTELLWEHAETVVRLVKFIPPMLKVVYFNVDDPDLQRFWMTAAGVAFGKAPFSDIEKARAARNK